MSQRSAPTPWVEVAGQHAHRPWPLPSRPWVLRMQWHDLLFAHWPVPVGVLRERVPACFSIDTFDGEAWLGVVPFRMTHVGPRGLPFLPGASAFLELNVRTYVTVADKPGVYFLSLDAASALAVAVARRWFRLPYFNAEMTLSTENATRCYRSHRTHHGAPAADFAGTYAPSGPAFTATPGTLEHWLTERYCLYTVDARGRPRRGEIHHRAWPLQPAEGAIEVNTMAASHGVALPACAPLLHFAERLVVVAWPLAPAV